MRGKEYGPPPVPLPGAEKAGARGETIRSMQFWSLRGDEADAKNDRLFLGIVNRIDYPVSISEDIQLWPRWKGVFRKINPAFEDDLETTEWSHYFMLTSKYSIIPTTYLEYGVEFDLFRNLEERGALFYKR